jgi:hypothetical protein
MAQRIRILARNVIEAATVTASPALVAGLDEALLQRPTERGIYARTTSAAVQEFYASFDSAQRVNVVGFTRTNWTTDADLRSYLYGFGSPAATLHDTGTLDAFAPDLDTRHDDYTALDFRGFKTSLQYFDLYEDVYSIMSRVNDPTNPAGYYEQRKWWAGEYIEFTYSPPFGGAELTLHDESKGGRADDGTHVVDRGWRARKLRLSLEFIPDAQLATVLAMVRRVGRTGEIVVDLYPDDNGARGLYNRMACRVTDSPTFNPHQVGLHRNTLALEET